MVVVEHGYGFSTYYAHNKMNMVEVGQKVKRGAVLGYVGSTGNATGVMFIMKYGMTAKA